MNLLWILDRAVKWLFNRQRQLLREDMAIGISLFSSNFLEAKNNYENIICLSL